MRGICLFPAMHRFAIQDDRVRAIFDVAAARPGTAVFVHCGVLSIGVRKKLGLPSPFDIRFGNPIERGGRVAGDRELTGVLVARIRILGIELDRVQHGLGRAR